MATAAPVCQFKRGGGRAWKGSEGAPPGPIDLAGMGHRVRAMKKGGHGAALSCLRADQLAGAGVAGSAGAGAAGAASAGASVVAAAGAAAGSTGAGAGTGGAASRLRKT